MSDAKRKVCEEAWVWMEVARQIADRPELAAQPILLTVFMVHALMDRSAVPARRYIDRMHAFVEENERGIAFSPDERVIACLLLAEQAQSDWHDKMVSALCLTECTTAYTAADTGTYNVSVVNVRKAA